MQPDRRPASLGQALRRWAAPAAAVTVIPGLIVAATLLRQPVPEALGGAESGSCEAVVRPARRLTLSAGRTAYVEPSGFTWWEGQPLLAGAPSYGWRRLGDRVVPDSAPAPLALVVGSDTTAAAVAAPPDLRRIGAVRIAAGHDGSLRAIVADTSRSEFGQIDSVIWWDAVFHHGGWTRSRIPIPDPQTLDDVSATALVATPSGFEFAVPAKQGPRIDARVQSFRDGRWQLVRVPTRGAGNPSLLVLPDGSRLLALTAADTSKQSDQNSLFLYRGTDAGWQRLGVLIPGGQPHVREPALSLDGPRVVAAWLSVGPDGVVPQVAAVELPLAHGPINRPGANASGILAVHSAEVGPASWVVFGREGGRETISLWTWSGSAAVLRDRVVNPFAGSTAVAYRDGPRVRVIGALQGEFPATEPVASAVVELFERCP